MKTSPEAGSVLPAWLCCLATCFVLSAAAIAQTTLPYRDPKLPVEQRVADLLSRMTLEEKVAQMEGAWENRQFFSDPKALFVDGEGNFVPERAAVLLKNGIGEISRPSENRGPRQMAEYTNTVQKWVRENTRLGIPVLFHDECLHGHVAPQGTSYPQAIALSSTWDTALVENVFTATAAEVRARGAHHSHATVLDLGRDPAGAVRKKPTARIPTSFLTSGSRPSEGFRERGPWTTSM